jgi:cytochrome c oxidase subunit 2
MLVVIGVVAFVATAAVAVFIPWLPTQASEEREGIDFVFWLATWICVAVFAVVAAVMTTAILKFRARPDDDSDGAPIHGHTGLEIVWTAVPALLVIVLGIASAVVLAQNDKARGANPNRIEVLAQQFAWQFTYPNGVSDGTLRLPVNRSTELQLTARDVIHSFFVPEFGQKRDAVPGTTTELVITPKRTGQFELECTELCGLGHALMRTKVIVLSQAEYERYLQRGDGGAQ